MRAAALPAVSGLPAARRSKLGVLQPPLLLAAVMAGLVLVVPPAGEYAINDDTPHIWVVQSLVDYGRLDLSPLTAPLMVLQAIWGALFVKLFGFSFTTLRASTLVLGAAGVFGCYVLLRDLLDARRALVGALMLLLNPLYVFLSYSFGTDVPFLAVALWALVCYGRALRAEQVRVGWLVAGSVLAGGAFLVRQVGLALPLAALGSLALVRGWRGVRLAELAALAVPFIPALLIGAYFDQQRGPIRHQTLAWTLAFWADNGPGLAGVVLSRLAGAFVTLGLFSLPLSLSVAVGRAAAELSRRQRWVAIGALGALATGLVLRLVVFRQRPLLPYVPDILDALGFLAVPLNGTWPSSIVIPEAALVVVTAAALLGAALFIVASVKTLTPGVCRGPRAPALVFGMLALSESALYLEFNDRYLIVLLPSALLMSFLAWGDTRFGRPLALGGVALLAVWSVWWERDYLGRQDAVWRAGALLVERGAPPERIDGGFEWNEWYRGRAAVAAAIEAVSQGKPDENGRRLQRLVGTRLDASSARWAVTFAPPKAEVGGSVVASVPYGNGHQVVAIQRF